MFLDQHLYRSLGRDFRRWLLLLAAHKYGKQYCESIAMKSGRATPNTDTKLGKGH